jgi:hypothetical protein
MGGFTAMRNHLLNLMPECFRRQLPPEERAVDLVIVDLMQFMAKAAKYGSNNEYFSAANVALDMRQIVESYARGDDENYRATMATVVLMDSLLCGATNKSFTQLRRDGNKKKKQSEPNRPVSAQTATETILDAEKYGRLAQNHSFTECLLRAQEQLACSGTLCWRSLNLKVQLYRVVTEMLLHSAIPEGQQLLIDDGYVWDDERYRQQSQQMVANNAMIREDQVDDSLERRYARECLVGNLVARHYVKRFVLYDNGQFQRADSTGVGESDIKLCRYIVRGNATQSYVVVSQDTDVLFVLLLHLKRLWSPEDGFGGLRLWVDTQTPYDRSQKKSRCYRFVDIVALYEQIVAFFAREFPQVKQPIETLVLLTYLLETDFTDGLHSSLGVNETTVWNQFAEMHTSEKLQDVVQFNGYCYDEETATAAQRKAHKAEKLGIKRQPRRYRQWALPPLLANCVAVHYQPQSDCYDLVLETRPLQRFMYLLCQPRIMEYRRLCGLSDSNGGTKAHNAPVLDTVDELLLCVRQIEECLRVQQRDTAVAFHTLCQQQQQQKAVSNTTATTTTTTTTTTKLKLPSVKRITTTSAVEAVLDDSIEEEEEEGMDVETVGRHDTVPRPSQPTFNRDGVQQLRNKQLPVNCGVPTLEQMLARLYRCEWLLNYHQNGWCQPQIYSHNFGDRHENDPTRSCHGWQLEEITQTPENVARGVFNNTYLYVQPLPHKECQPGQLPFRAYEVTESDHVYNRQFMCF